jgi:predicted metal-dependent hydrolase
MIKYAITRSKRKTAAIYVRDGAVEVRAPLRMPKADIDKFVAAKEKWITGRFTKTQEQDERREAFGLNYGDTLTACGKEYAITPKLGNRVGFADGVSYMPPDLDGGQIKAACVQIYKLLAKKVLTEKVEIFGDRMGVKPSAVKINSAKTRWGSCFKKSPTKPKRITGAGNMRDFMRNIQAATGATVYNINFSWRLIMAGEETVDYVVVHELAHITELNHSEELWAIVAGLPPDYKVWRKRLKILQRKLNGEDWD